MIKMRWVVEWIAIFINKLCVGKNGTNARVRVQELHLFFQFGWLPRIIGVVYGNIFATGSLFDHFIQASPYYIDIIPVRNYSGIIITADNIP
jgi:hypothetical protein